MTLNRPNECRLPGHAKSRNTRWRSFVMRVSLTRPPRLRARLRRLGARRRGGAGEVRHERTQAWLIPWSELRCAHQVVQPGYRKLRWSEEAVPHGAVLQTLPC